MQASTEGAVSTLNIRNIFPDWGYLISAPLSSSQGFTAVFVVILAVVFLLAMRVFLRHLWRSHRRISFLIEKLKDIQSDDLIQQREQIKQDMSENKECSELWIEFDESLVESTDPKVCRLYNTIDAAHFFDTHTLARGMTESRLIAAIPGILTAIGVLGTFFGLTLGLSGLGEIGESSTQHLESGISGMLHAASIAFMTSFWGVLSSVLFNFFEKLFESGTRKKIAGLQDRIDHLFPRLTPEKALMDISRDSKISAETMQGLAEKIGNRMQEAVAHSLQEVLVPALLQMRDDISAGMSKSLQEVLAPAIGKLVESAEDMTNRQTQSSEKVIEKTIHSFMEQFGQAGAEQGQMMRGAAQHLQEVMEKIKQEQEKSMQRSDTLDEKRQQALTDTIELISDQFNMFKSVGEQNTQVAEDVVQQQKHVTASVQKVSDDLLTFAGMIEGVSGQLSEAAKEIKEGNQELARTSQIMAGTVSDAARSNERVSQSNQKTSQELQGLLDRIESSRASAETISTQLRASAEAGKDTFAELRKHQEDYRNALNNHVKELEEQISNIMEQYATEVTEQTHHRLQAWDEETNKYTSAMQGVLNVMQNLVDDMDNQRT